MPVTHQTRVGFGTALDGARFATAGPVGYQIGGQHAEELLAQLSAASFGAGLQAGFAVASRHGQAASKTHWFPQPLHGTPRQQTVDHQAPSGRNQTSQFHGPCTRTVTRKIRIPTDQLLVSGK